MTVSLAHRQYAYEQARDVDGLTVAEWEAANGLPPFSVYPTARGAWKPSHDMFAMYAPDEREAALVEDERQMECLRSLGIAVGDIAELFHCPYAYAWKKSGKPQKTNAVELRLAEAREMAALRSSGMKLREIAALYKCSIPGVWGRLRMVTQVA